MQVYKVTTET